MPGAGAKLGKRKVHVRVRVAAGCAPAAHLVPVPLVPW